MRFLFTAAVLAATGTAGAITPGAAFGQAGGAAPGLEAGPAAPSGDPADPDQTAPAPVVPPPAVPPRTQSSPGLRGSGCDHRAPGTGV
jgi:hypothetical protein